jgi:hypothetical protein
MSFRNANAKNVNVHTKNQWRLSMVNGRRDKKYISREDKSLWHSLWNTLEPKKTICFGTKENYLRYFHLIPTFPASFVLHKNKIMMVISRIFQTKLLPENLGPLDCAMEFGDHDQIDQDVDLWLSSSSVDSIANPLEGVYYKQAAASTVQPSESTNSFGQSCMECTVDSTHGEKKECLQFPWKLHDSTHGEKKECLQFPWKLHEMLDDADVEGFSDIVSWLPGSTFKVHQPGVFVEGIMPRYFKKIKFKSFRRQINMWGFKRIKGGAGKGGYRHPNFIRGVPSLCCTMKRVKIKGTGTRPRPLVASNDGHSCVPSLETVQIPNDVNPYVLEREKPQEDWCRIHESSLLQFARQVLSLPNSASLEVFSSDDIAQELVSTFSVENEAVVG